MRILFDGQTYEVEGKQEVQDLLAHMADAIMALEARIAKLEANPRATRLVGPDNIGQRILKFLAEHPGIKWTPGALAENIEPDDISTDQVGVRLRTLAEKDMVNVHQPTNGSKTRVTYSYKPQPPFPLPAGHRHV